ncbi:MAG: lysophospholipid acyltransferase family protein [Limisphaerales bacterium]
MKSPLMACLVRLATGVTARWVGCGPALCQRIYFANHTSHLDTLVLWAVLPTAVREHTRPIAARDYWGANAVRRCVAQSLFNAVLVDRKRICAHDHPVEHMVEALGTTNSIILFPEGERTPGPEVAPFKSGIWHLARQRPEMELVPVYLENLNQILPKGEFLPVPLLCRATFGQPIHLQPGEGKTDFLHRTRNALDQLRQT